MELNRTEKSPTFNEISSRILPSYFKDTDDEEDEDQDDDEERDYDGDYDDYDDNDDGYQENLECKSPQRSRQKTTRVTSIYTRPQPKQTPVGLQIVIDGIKNNLPRAEINQKLIMTFNNGGSSEDLRTIFCRPNSDGVTALTVTVLCDIDDVAVCLLIILFNVFPSHKEAIQYINKIDYEGNTIVHEMAYMGPKTLKTMERLLKLRLSDITKNVERAENTKLPIFDPYIVNKCGQHPIHFCFKGPTFCKEAITVFHNLNPNILASKDSAQNNILHYFMVHLPDFCDNFRTCKAAATAVREALEFLIDFDVVKDCLLAGNVENKTALDVFKQIKQLPREAWHAVNDLMEKKMEICQPNSTKPVLLQIPFDILKKSMDDSKMIEAITFDEEVKDCRVKPTIFPTRSNLLSYVSQDSGIETSNEDAPDAYNFSYLGETSPDLTSTLAEANFSDITDTLLTSILDSQPNQIVIPYYTCSALSQQDSTILNNLFPQQISEQCNEVFYTKQQADQHSINVHGAALSADGQVLFDGGSLDINSLLNIEKEFEALIGEVSTFSVQGIPNSK